MTVSVFLGGAGGFSGCLAFAGGSQQGNMEEFSLTAPRWAEALSSPVQLGQPELAGRGRALGVEEWGLGR